MTCKMRKEKNEKNDNIAVADINKCLTYTELEDQINITIKKNSKIRYSTIRCCYVKSRV